MSKLVKCGNDAINDIVVGVDTVADIVKTTLGPRGRNILIRNQVSNPIITNDGVTIAKSIQLKDNVQDAGAQLIISASNKTNDVAGDGTTTTVVLAQSLIHNFIKTVGFDNTTINVVQIQKDMIEMSNKISEYLSSISTPVNNTQSIQRVATISSGNDHTGELIADAFEVAGSYGSVIVEDSKTGKDEIVNIQGMRIPNGMVTPYLFNDRIELKSDMVDVNLLIIKDKIDNATDLLPILDACIKQSLKLVIMCDDIDYETLNMIITNKARGVPLNVSIIRNPGFGKLKEDLLQDISIATGATIIDRDAGITLKQFDLSLLGELDEITITMDDTVMKFKDVTSNSVNLANNRKQRVDEIKHLLLGTDKPEDQEQYKRRISNLVGGISVIQVGANSDLELKDKKLRIEDALNSVKSAIAEGVVPGGGYSFLLTALNFEKEELTTGEQIVIDSLNSITKQIADNAGFNGEEVVETCRKSQLGFNALTGGYENLLDTGVINSAKVDRYCVINAVSVAATVITMGGFIVEENEPEKNVFQLQSPIG